jgi:putative ABC transport system permease protein
MFGDVRKYYAAFKRMLCKNSLGLKFGSNSEKVFNSKRDVDSNLAHVQKVKNLGVFTRALRNVSRRKIRVLLVVFALSLSMAILVSIPAGIMANQEAAEELKANYEDYLGDIEEEIEEAYTLLEVRYISGGFLGGNGGLPEGGGGFSGGGGGSRPGFFRSENFFNESLVLEIEILEGTDAVIPFFEKSEGTTQTFTTRFGMTVERLVPDYTIIGVVLDNEIINYYNVLPNTILEGRNLEEGDTGVVLLSLNSTDYFGAGVGDQVGILGNTFTVVGIYDETDILGLNRVYMSLSEAQAITDLEGQITSIDVYAADESIINQLALEISALDENITISTYETRLSGIELRAEMAKENLELAEATLSQTQALAYQEIGIAVVATCLIVLFTMLYTVRERTKEIGVLKAIGFSNGNIMSQFMLEGVIISAIAGLVGVAIGTVAAPVLSTALLQPVTGNSIPETSFVGMQVNIPGSSLSATAANPSVELLLLVFVGAVLLGALGTLYPAWRASRTSPMEALRHE